MRAWLALKAAGVDFDEVVVDIRRPQRFANLAAVGAFAPSATVPVLVVDEHVIFDSLAIMEYANDVAGGRLLPVDPLHRAEARSIIAWQHGGLSGIARRVCFESAFYPDKRDLCPEEIAECDRLGTYLAACLARSGGPFLFGECSLADFALTPTVIRLTRHQLDWARWPGTEPWSGHVLDHLHVKEWLREADLCPPIWYDSYMLDPERTPSASSAWTAVREPRGQR
ncbi:glutathione S-transferase family protein [Lysobacter auxotrophicus]|uniref:Glutathione S-transferase family protein n=1 Tax=Lysobacter auxotrophicus TaxID=2992573 RepID=A0ABM8DHN3_9GAMM|nr:glutathione S-transferase family protein [Lysobacter auxotrophicus]BDU18128.1 glutathione S-transferase family protein [Lysobacter auxotrophicus]